MPTVVLIRPLCEGDELEFAEPLGIERLAGYLKGHAVPDVHVFDRRLYRMEHRAGFFDDIRSKLGDTEPTVVGLSLMTSADVPDARRIMSRLGAWWPKALLVAGGVFVTCSPDEAQRLLPKRTVLLRGEGEARLLELATGRMQNAGANLFVGPDEWAVPYRPHLERYARLGCAVNMQASRGCSGTCAFCATPSLPKVLRRWQGRSLELVVDEMQQVAERLAACGLPPIFNFVDDSFGPFDRLEALADELGRRRMSVAFACEMRLAALIGQPQLAKRLEHLHNAGLTRVFFGVESLNANTLARWRKPYDVAALPQVLAAFRSSGIEVQAGYIMWHAEQTVEGALAEVIRLQELGIYNHKAALSRLIVFPGCALAQESTDTAGFQSLGAREEAFYRQFAAQTAELTRAWTQAAVAEPYALAIAHLSGEEGRLTELRNVHDEINEQSYQLFLKMAKEMCS